jgi:hypothetical protein
MLANTPQPGYFMAVLPEIGPPSIPIMPHSHPSEEYRSAANESPDCCSGSIVVATAKLG